MPPATRPPNTSGQNPGPRFPSPGVATDTTSVPVGVEARRAESDADADAGEAAEETEEPDVAEGSADAGAEPEGLDADAAVAFGVAAPGAGAFSAGLSFSSDSASAGSFSACSVFAGSVFVRSAPGTALPAAPPVAFAPGVTSLEAEALAPTLGTVDPSSVAAARPSATGASVEVAPGEGASGVDAANGCEEVAAVSGVAVSGVRSSPDPAFDASAPIEVADEIPVFAGLFVLRAKSSPPAVVARDTPGTFDHT